MDEVRTATLDLKNRRNRPPTSTPVPFADIEDDHNISPYSGKVSPPTVVMYQYQWRREGVCRPGQTSLLPPPPLQSDLQLIFLWLQRWH